MTPSPWTGGDSVGLAWEMGGQTQEEACQAGRPRPGHGAGGPCRSSVETSRARSFLTGFTAHHQSRRLNAKQPARAC